MPDAKPPKNGKWISPSVFNAILADFDHHGRLIWQPTVLILILQTAALAGAWSIGHLWGGFALVLVAAVTLVLYLLINQSHAYLKDRAHHLDHLADRLQGEAIDETHRFRAMLDEGQLDRRRLLDVLIIGLLIIDAILATLTFVGVFGPAALTAAATMP